MWGTESLMMARQEMAIGERPRRYLRDGDFGGCWGELVGRTSDWDEVVIMTGE